ncbi:MAG: hypothetical protein ABIM89_05110 [Mycobacteriales bacterium]
MADNQMEAQSNAVPIEPFRELSRHGLLPLGGAARSRPAQATMRPGMLLLHLAGINA